MKNNRYDGMIITGAPVETMDFEQVDYWPELCEIMDFSETNVYSTLHVCWGAQAGLYYHYGVHKELLPEKMFGVFEHRVTRPANPLVRGFDEVFYAPHSRHTGIRRADVDACDALRILAESDVAGPFLMSTENGRQIFVTGHPEYDKYTLDAEYKRDVAKGLPIHVPVNYYPDDDPEQPPLFRWRAHAHLLYENWLINAKRLLRFSTPGSRFCVKRATETTQGPRIPGGLVLYEEVSNGGSKWRIRRRCGPS